VISMAGKHKKKAFVKNLKASRRISRKTIAYKVNEELVQQLKEKKVKDKELCDENTAPTATESEQTQGNVKQEIENDPQKNDNTEENNNKTQIVARNLLRLYQYLQMDKPLEQKDLIHELEFDTPNEEYRKKIDQLDLENQSLLMENQMLRESALQTQVEYSDQIEMLENDNNEMKGKLGEIDKIVKTELEKRIKKYEEIITDLRNKLREAVEKNQKFTEVNDVIVNLQENITSLFDQNEQLLKHNETLQKQIEDAEQGLSQLQEKIFQLESKNKELAKKNELQKMVIDGYKRKESDGESAAENPEKLGNQNE
jgi:hypothetical protein